VLCHFQFYILSFYHSVSKIVKENFHDSHINCHIMEVCCYPEADLVYFGDTDR
jgi:hypothetical protein